MRSRLIGSGRPCQSLDAAQWKDISQYGWYPFGDGTSCSIEFIRQPPKALGRRLRRCYVGGGGVAGGAGIWAASGLGPIDGPIAGIYCAIAVGFFAAVFGGTPSQISGPTGPMTVAMAVIVTRHASSPAEAFTIVILAGLLQIALGTLRIGSFVAYTPYSVISGFMSGIGAIIIAVQALPFLGALPVSGGPLNSIRALPDAWPP